METRPLKRTVSNVSSEGEYALLLLNSATSFHCAHLIEKNYAAHKAMQKYYEAIPDLVDSFVEQYQGVMGTIVSYPNESTFKVIKSSGECLSLIKEVYVSTDAIQKKCSHSEIMAVLDEIKSLCNNTKYKLSFLS